MEYFSVGLYILKSKINNKKKEDQKNNKILEDLCHELFNHIKLKFNFVIINLIPPNLA